MTPDISTELAAVRELALAAGTILLDSLGKVGRVERKTATEFVTDVDRRVEDVLVAGIRELFPGDAVVAEESGATAGGERTWYIDPLDGTTNYAHGYPFFSVSIACARAGELMMGLVLAPYLDELYLADAGRGGRVERPGHGESRPLDRRTPVDLEEALLATGFPYLRNEVVDHNTRLAGAFLKARCHGLRRGGSAAIDLCHVAAGKLDGYWEWGLRPWDTAAGTLIAREAGALVTDFTGKEILIPTAHILAAAPGLHGRMSEMIAPVLADAGARGKARDEQ